MALYAISKLDEVFFLELSSTGEITRSIISMEKFGPLRQIETTTSWAATNGADCVLKGEDRIAIHWINASRKRLRDFYLKELLADKKITPRL